MPRRKETRRKKEIKENRRVLFLPLGNQGEDDRESYRILCHRETDKGVSMRWKLPKELLSFLLFVLLLFLPLSLQAITSVEEQEKQKPQSESIESSENTSSTENNLIDRWNALENLLQMLEKEANESPEDSKRLQELLSESLTEISGLSILLEQSEKQLKDLESAQEAERTKAQETIQASIERAIKAERSRDRWRAAAIVSAITIISLIVSQ